MRGMVYIDKKKKESRIQNQKPRKRSDIKNNRGKLDSERHLKSENIKGTRPFPYTGIIKQDEIARSISSMKRELNLSPSLDITWNELLCFPLFHWLRDPLKPASVLKLFFFFPPRSKYFTRPFCRDKKRLEKYIKRFDTERNNEKRDHRIDR